MRITKENAIAILIDIQEKLYPVMTEKDELLKNLQLFIQGLEALNLPVFFTQQYTKGLGETIDEIRQHVNNFEYSEKIAFSCCEDEAFMNKISALDKQYVIVAGIEAHVCVLQTVIDLKEKGFVPVVVTDAISARKAYHKEVALKRMTQEGALLTTVESVLFEICRYAGTSGFKTISKLVK